ncbi:MAG: GNAT family N-acetyltransferase [Thermaceae bacterium]|nr:GNAT family N-acetyltransferase [Thermaceae bacterium]
MVALLQDVVDGGASVGFLPPLSVEEAQAYWLEVHSAIQGPYKLLWVALEGEEVTGTVQLNLESRANGIHRAEVAKLMVGTAHRRKGIPTVLMEAAENEAERLGRTTLVLDTLEGHEAERLYLSLGWQKAGVIPQYARWQDGKLYGTVVMYKIMLG